MVNTFLGFFFLFYGIILFLLAFVDVSKGEKIIVFDSLYQKIKNRKIVLLFLGTLSLFIGMMFLLHCITYKNLFTL